MKISQLSKAVISLSCILLPILTTPVRAVDSAQRAAQLAPYIDDQTIAVIGLQAQAIDLDAILKRTGEIDALKSQAALFQELAGRVRQPLESLRSTRRKSTCWSDSDRSPRRRSASSLSCHAMRIASRLPSCWIAELARR